jgi:hypothetical protein
VRAVFEKLFGGETKTFFFRIIVDIPRHL